MPKNAKVILGILLVFLLGAASGALVTHMIHQARLEAFINGGPAMREEYLVKRLTRELNLDSGQQDQIRGIVHETHTAMLDMRRQMRPGFEALLEQGQERISSVLRPEQREKFAKLMVEHKPHRFRDRPSPGQP